MEQRMQWYSEARFGMFIHWGLYAIPARGEWVRNVEKLSNEAYQPYFNEFNPVRYDPRQWAQTARRAGMKYAVLTAKHHDGFCLFDSKHTDFKATNTPARRDLIREYVEAFRSEGLKVGFYYSLLDWHHPHFFMDSTHPMYSDEKVRAEKRDMSKYVEYLHGQVRELLSNYGKIDIIWFDYSYGELSGEAWKARDLMKMVRALQPHIITNNRLEAGHHGPPSTDRLGDISTPEQTIPPEGVRDTANNPVAWEACVTLNDHWGYGRNDKNFKSTKMLVRMLVECVSKNGNFLLNVGPNALGEIPPESAQRLEEIGQWIDRHGDSIYGAGAAADLAKPEWGRFTQKGKTLYAHVLEKTAGPIPIPGWKSRVRKARLLLDGSEVSIAKPWNVEADSPDLYLHLPLAQLPDEIDTVVALELS